MFELLRGLQHRFDIGDLIEFQIELDGDVVEECFQQLELIKLVVEDSLFGEDIIGHLKPHLIEIRLQILTD